MYFVYFWCILFTFIRFCLLLLHFVYFYYISFTFRTFRLLLGQHRILVDLLTCKYYHSQKSAELRLGKTQSNGKQEWSPNKTTPGHVSQDNNKVTSKKRKANTKRPRRNDVDLTVPAMSEDDEEDPMSATDPDNMVVEDETEYNTGNTHALPCLISNNCHRSQSNTS